MVWDYESWKKYTRCTHIPHLKDKFHESTSAFPCAVQSAGFYSMHTQSCPTLCDPVDCSPPGSSVHVVFKARILEWVAISFFRGLFHSILLYALLFCLQNTGHDPLNGCHSLMTCEPHCTGHLPRKKPA